MHLPLAEHQYGVAFADTGGKIPTVAMNAVTVNMISMQVMKMIFEAVMGKLPSTTYIKMVNVWLIVGLLVPFTEVVLLTIMEALRDAT